MLLLAGWVCAALLLGLAAGVMRTDLLLVVPATVLVASLVAMGGARLGARRLALTLTVSSACLLADVTWGQVAGTVLSATAILAANAVTRFLRPSGRRRTGPRRA